MNRYVIAAVLALGLAGSAHAAVIDLALSPTGPSAQALRTSQPVRNLSVTSRSDVVAPPAHMSELPEPEVFAMMLLGLVLIGYRASRDSSEKFK